MNIIHKILNYLNIDLEKNMENRLIKIKKLKNKKRKRKGRKWLEVKQLISMYIDKWVIMI